MHDLVVCRRARLRNATKDSDFPERVLIEGGPPKILWLQLGNCSTTEIEKLLRDVHREISEMDTSANEVLLIVP